jgi:hypothetical protein
LAYLVAVGLAVVEDFHAGDAAVRRHRQRVGDEFVLAVDLVDEQVAEQGVAAHRPPDLGAAVVDAGVGRLLDGLALGGGEGDGLRLVAIGGREQQPLRLLDREVLRGVDHQRRQQHRRSQPRGGRGGHAGAPGQKL